MNRNEGIEREIIHTLPESEPLALREIRGLVERPAQTHEREMAHTRWAGRLRHDCATLEERKTGESPDRVPLRSCGLSDWGAASC